MSIDEVTFSDLTNTHLDMVNRFKSLFQNVGTIEYDDYEDDDDTDSEEEFRNKTCKNKNDEISNEDQTVVSNDIEKDKLKEEINLNSDTIIEEEEKENYDLEEDSESEFYKPDIDEYYKKHAGEHDQDPCFMSENEIRNQLESLALKPMTIQTDYTYDFNNQKSPRTQISELSNDLERYKKENDDLTHECDKLKQDKENFKDEIKIISLKNEKMNSELKQKNELVKQLQSSNSTNQNSDQIQKLRHENQQLYQKLSDEQSNKAELEKQIQKLQKCESMLKKIDLVQINKKIYQIINRIGKGGFSEVYCCLSYEDKKTYALKKSDLSNLDEDNTKLVFKETETMKALQNTDKVVKFIDHEYKVNKKVYYVLMEMGSCDLSHIFKKEIAKHNCVQEPMRLYYWKKMLDAVKAVHDLGVVHSDLKPANFILVNDAIKLIDFNISNTMGDRTSVTVQNECGTIEYMSPDMFLKDEKSDGRVNKKLDVWSMGIILYFMVYGKLPLQHIKTFPKKMYAICDPSQKEFVFAPIENEMIIDTIHKCLIHDPSERYSIEKLLNHPYITSKR